MMKKTEKSQSENVIRYIASAPQIVQTKLRQIRKAILQSAPGAIEKISYGMPYYDYNGRLAYFRFNQKHIGLYLPPPIIDEHKRYLKDYSTTKATIRLPLDKKIPIALIKKLIKARIRHNSKF